MRLAHTPEIAYSSGSSGVTEARQANPLSWQPEGSRPLSIFLDYSMSSFDIQLLLTALVSVLVLVALIVSRIRMHPLLALLIVSIGVGFATGMAPTAIVKNLTDGAGKTLGAVGVGKWPAQGPGG